VADAAIWLILNSFRNFSWSSIAARSQDPEKFRDAHQNIAAVTHNPNGFSLGIIGLGRIGYRIAQKAHVAFSMKIIYHDIARMSEEIEKSVDAEFFAGLDEMLAASDCVLLATPFVGEKVMNEKSFARMKPGSRFVNIARGKLVDEESLVVALRSGHLVSAGLDVHYDEPNVNSALASMPNVEMLSHTAGGIVTKKLQISYQNISNYMFSLVRIAYGL
jgi:lactate dehydrogenase-like 2-hydroxyacid dehydrogenase